MHARAGAAAEPARRRRLRMSRHEREVLQRPDPLLLLRAIHPGVLLRPRREPLHPVVRDCHRERRTCALPRAVFRIPPASEASAMLWRRTMAEGRRNRLMRRCVYALAAVLALVAAARAEIVRDWRNPIHYPARVIAIHWES